MKIHHIGYLVDSVELSSKEFEHLGFSGMGEIVLDHLRKIYILFIENQGFVIELIQPMDETSPIYNLRKKYRNAPYHICYETEDLQKEIEQKVVSGYTLIQSPQPASAIMGRPNVAFLMHKQIGMIELVEV